jgi:hypothetical protein
MTYIEQNAIKTNLISGEIIPFSTLTSKMLTRNLPVY